MEIFGWIIGIIIGFYLITNIWLYFLPYAKYSEWVGTRQAKKTILNSGVIVSDREQHRYMNKFVRILLKANQKNIKEIINYERSREVEATMEIFIIQVLESPNDFNSNGSPKCGWEESNLSIYI